MMSPHPDRRPPRLALLPVVAMLLALGASCGISLSAEGDASELFQELVLPERVTAGEEVSLVIEYEQPYPVAIDIECDLFEQGVELEEGERGTVFYEGVILANPNGGPADEATPVAGAQNATFTAPTAPGTYVVRCLTSKDENSALVETFEVVAGEG